VIIEKSVLRIILPSHVVVASVMKHLHISSKTEPKLVQKFIIFSEKNLTCLFFKHVDIVGKTDWFVQTNVWLFYTNDDLNFDLIDFSGKIFQNSPHLH